MSQTLGFALLDLALTARPEPSLAVRRLVTCDAVGDGLRVRDARLLGHVISIERSSTRSTG